MKFFATWSVKVLWTSCLEKDEKLNIDFQTFIVFLYPYTLATYLIDPFFEIRSVLHTCMSKFGLMFWVIFCHCFQKYLLWMFKRWMKLVEHKQVNTYKTYYRSRGGFRRGGGAAWATPCCSGCPLPSPQAAAHEKSNISEVFPCLHFPPSALKNDIKKANISNAMVISKYK